MKVDEAGIAALLAHAPGRASVRQLRTIVQAALVESDGDRLMLEQALAGDLDRRRVRSAPWGLYDDAKQDFERRFYTALYVRFNEEPVANLEGGGQAARDGKGGPARPGPARRHRIHGQGDVSALAGRRVTGCHRRSGPIALEPRRVLAEAVAAEKLIEQRSPRTACRASPLARCGRAPRRPRGSPAAWTSERARSSRPAKIDPKASDQILETGSVGTHAAADRRRSPARGGRGPDVAGSLAGLAR